MSSRNLADAIGRFADATYLSSINLAPNNLVGP